MQRWCILGIGFVLACMPDSSFHVLSSRPYLQVPPPGEVFLGPDPAGEMPFSWSRVSHATAYTLMVNGHIDTVIPAGRTSANIAVGILQEPCQRAHMYLLAENAMQRAASGTRVFHTAHPDIETKPLEQVCYDASRDSPITLQWESLETPFQIDIHNKTDQTHTSFADIAHPTMPFQPDTSRPGTPTSPGDSDVDDSLQNKYLKKYAWYVSNGCTRYPGTPFSVLRKPNELDAHVESRCNPPAFRFHWNDVHADSYRILGSVDRSTFGTDVTHGERPSSRFLMAEIPGDRTHSPWLAPLPQMYLSSYLDADVPLYFYIEAVFDDCIQIMRRPQMFQHPRFMRPPVRVTPTQGRHPLTSRFYTRAQEGRFPVYYADISEDPTFSTIDKTLVIRRQASHRWEKPGTYYYRVRDSEHIDENTCLYTDPLNTIRSEGAGCPSLDLEGLHSLRLISTTPPLFEVLATWSGGVGPYAVSVSSDPSFGEGTITTGGITDTEGHIGGIPPGTYYWRVSDTHCGSQVTHSQPVPIPSSRFPNIDPPFDVDLGLPGTSSEEETCPPVRNLRTPTPPDALRKVPLSLEILWDDGGPVQVIRTAYDKDRDPARSETHTITHRILRENPHYQDIRQPGYYRFSVRNQCETRFPDDGILLYVAPADCSSPLAIQSSPLDDYADVPVRLHWKGGRGPYRIEYSQQSNFAVLASTQNHHEGADKIETALPPGVYYYRVVDTACGSNVVGTQTVTRHHIQDLVISRDRKR